MMILFMMILLSYDNVFVLTNRVCFHIWDNLSQGFDCKNLPKPTIRRWNNSHRSLLKARKQTPDRTE
jgi:hypothetical protein